MVREVTLIQPQNLQLATPDLQFPLGLLYLAAVLEQRGHRVRIADLRSKEIIQPYEIPKADLYGITATTGEYPQARALASMIKRHDPEAVTVVGGAHPSHMPEHCVGDFDCVVVGEGERAILKVVEDGARGIVRDNPIEDLDSIPFPARHLAPDACFSETLFVGEKYGVGPRSTSIISSRGCPYNCAFCANIPQPVRFRSPENLAAEVREIKEKYGCRHLRFVDDNFTLNRRRLLRICELLEPLGIRFRCHTRSNPIDEEMCEAMHRSGCEEVGLGIESADDEVLKKVNKRETVEDHRRAVGLIKEAGMRAKTFWMIGLPGETDESIEKNMEFVREMKPDRWTVSVFTPYPICDIYRNPSKYGVVIEDQNLGHYWNFPDYPVHRLENASREEIWGRYKRFYSFMRSDEWR